MKEILKDFYKTLQDKYYEKAAENIGNLVEDVVCHPDTNQILSDNSFYSNEEEIEAFAEELFLEDLENKNLKDDFLNFVDNNYDIVINLLTK